MALSFKDTLNLPETAFPMRGDLPKREPKRFARWLEEDLHGKLLAKNAGGPAYILHDGPPFTNGDVHIGTALNKCLKDITLRYRSMKGYRTPYVPGWDCHGLPIEQKVARELQAKKQHVGTSELRRLCDEFAESWITRQRAQFQRLGILANWRAEYRTKQPAYEAEILRIFAAFIEKGLVYRSKKPVYWSIPFETALAEAEIEYKEHVSPSIWVRFPVPAAEADKFRLPRDKPLSLLIWTTTPWTIPANLAITLHPEIEYVVADLGPELLLVAAARLPATLEAARLGPAAAAVRWSGPGALLEHLRARHPLIERDSLVVLGDYVTTESGTGCVHTAPGHGLDDFLTGQRYGLDIYCPVADNGTYRQDGSLPPELVGLSILESQGKSPANEKVLELLRARQALFVQQQYTHQYPHCWRSKTPIIFRAVDQWFVGLDRKNADGVSPRDLALQAIAAVQWVPSFGEKRIRGAVESRPDWCISRQRSWGVPIPAFYDQEGRAWLDAGVVRAIADQVAEHGSNIWFERSPEQLLATVPRPADWPPLPLLSKGRDTLDVWIDSGSSHAAVLRRQTADGLSWPADLYLEGSDQHRGWFQSSLWTSVVACHGQAPYRTVLTHGFIVDEQREKISKSKQEEGGYTKPQTAEEFVKTYGADVIRLWISSQDFRDDITLSEKILQQAGEQYRSIRNTWKFQLGNLRDFDPVQDAVPAASLLPLDRWAVHKTAELAVACDTAYAAFEYHKVYQEVTKFVTVTLSATYHTLIKDRLYTFAPNSLGRRSAQTAIFRIFHCLTRILAPILVFTADEAYAYAQTDTETAPRCIHEENWPIPGEDWLAPEVVRAVDAILALVPQVNERLEALRQAKAIGRSLDAVLELRLPSNAPEKSLLVDNVEHLPELFGVSAVSLEASSDSEWIISARPADGHNCPRCWRWVPILVPTPLGDCCERCADALKSSPRSPTSTAVP